MTGSISLSQSKPRHSIDHLMIHLITCGTHLLNIISDKVAIPRRIHKKKAAERDEEASTPPRLGYPTAKRRTKKKIMKASPTLTYSRLVAADGVLRGADEEEPQEQPQSADQEATCLNHSTNPEGKNIDVSSILNQPFSYW